MKVCFLSQIGQIAILVWHVKIGKKWRFPKYFQHFYVGQELQYCHTLDFAPHLFSRNLKLVRSTSVLGLQQKLRIVAKWDTETPK